MLIDMVKEEEFQNLTEAHLKDMLFYLLASEQPFGLLCNLEHVTFDPPLPEEIASNLQELTLFMIAGYTFESFEIEEDKLFFEAGFGPDNFGSVVSMPVLAVLQILVEETPILINMAQPRPYFREARAEEGVKSSLETFLSNPENRKFLKK
ncbi:hypothetical protein [Hydrogenimonas sp. SS33]|uniref:hypothetical protein n=1 Tax=Hydrogenimonas leucolamina TaxID=2954236 RepID=UPI00336BEC7B